MQSAQMQLGVPVGQLSVGEIKVGLVSHLDQTMLTRDNEVLDTFPQRETELRPFVCIEVDGDQSTWAPLTSTYRRERLLIRDEWRIGGLGMWRDRVCYLCDGANLYVGPTASFVAASALEETTPANRSGMTEQGVLAVRDVVHRQKKRRINGCDS